MEAGSISDPTPVDAGRVNANGIDYYYEIHGEGEPLLVLHGGLGSIPARRTTTCSCRPPWCPRCCRS